MANCVTPIVFLVPFRVPWVSRGFSLTALITGRPDQGIGTSAARVASN